jgi:DNA-binding LacI/PurR family transcriptional regulator
MPSGSKSPAGKKPVGLKAIAQHVGLSTAAVSRVLSGSPAARSIPWITQQKIVDAAHLLEYQPNLVARSLRNRRSCTIGVMVPEVSEGYASTVLSGIESRLMEADCFISSSATIIGRI